MYVPEIDRHKHNFVLCYTAMSKQLYLLFLYDTQDFLIQFAHSGRFIDCQKKINSALKNFNVHDHEKYFKCGDDSSLPENLRDKNFLGQYIHKILEEFWKRPFLLERKRDNSLDFQNQIIERETVICNVLDVIYDTIDPPMAREKRIIDAVTRNVIEHFNVKIETLMNWLEEDSGDEKVGGKINFDELESADDKSEISVDETDVESEKPADVVEVKIDSEPEDVKSETENVVEEKIEVEKVIDAEIENVVDEKIVGGEKNKSEDVVEIENPVEPEKHDEDVADTSGESETESVESETDYEKMPELTPNEPIIVEDGGTCNAENEISPDDIAGDEKKDNVNSKVRNIYFRRPFGDPSLFSAVSLL